MKNVLKVFSVKITDKNILEELDKFQNNVTLENKTAQQKLYELMKEYNSRVKNKYTLMKETELLKAVKGTDISIGRSSLRKYRDLDVLKDSEGPFWYTNDSLVIIYLWEKMVEFLKSRKADPYSTLVSRNERTSE